MPEGLQFIKKICAAQAPRVSHVNFLRYHVHWVCPKVDTQPTLEITYLLDLGSFNTWV